MGRGEHLLYVRANPTKFVDPSGKFLEWGPIVRGFAYRDGERCRKFAGGLFQVSAIWVPLAMRAGWTLAVGLKNPLGGVFNELWFFYQNRCMFRKWLNQITPQWQPSRDTCGGFGWQTNQCCDARVRGEQSGFSECLTKTGWLARYHPLSDFVSRLDFEVRVQIGVTVSGCN